MSITSFAFGQGWDRVARSRADDAAGQARSARLTTAEVEARLERTLLACEALWSLMRERFSLTDVDLVQRINDIDLMDGQLDGRAAKGAVSCPKCKRTIGRRFPKCMYCGQAIVHDAFA